MPIDTMSEEQLSALLAKLSADETLQERLKGAADPDAAIAISKEAGFDLSKEEWFAFQAKQDLALNDKALERVAGGSGNDTGSDGYSCDCTRQDSPCCM